MGISSSSLDLAQTAGDDLFKELNEELLRLRAINPTEYEMLADEFLGYDGNVYATDKYTITDEEILSSPLSNKDNDENENDVVEKRDVPLSRLPTEELEEAISAILRAALSMVLRWTPLQMWRCFHENQNTNNKAKLKLEPCPILVKYKTPVIEL